MEVGDVMFNKRRRLYKRKKLLLFVTLSLVLLLGIGYSVVKDNILVTDATVNYRILKTIHL